MKFRIEVPLEMVAKTDVEDIRRMHKYIKTHGPEDRWQVSVFRDPVLLVDTLEGETDDQIFLGMNQAIARGELGEFFEMLDARGPS